MVVTPEFLVEFRKDFNEAMDALREKYDISISLGNITFEDERFSGKLSVVMPRDPEDIARASFDAEAWKFFEIGIQEGMYKRIFVGRNGRRYAILALKPRSYKSPLRIIDVETGERYRCGRDFVKEWTDLHYAQVLNDPDPDTEE